MKRHVNKFYFKYMKKSLIFMIILFLVLLFTVLGMFFFTFHDYTGFRLLYLFSRWNFFLCVLISTGLYYLYIEPSKAQCTEVICSISGKKDVWQKGVSRSFLLFWAVYLFIFTLLILGCSFLNDGTKHLLTIYPRSFLINIVFPQLIFIGVAYVSSCIYERNRMVSLSALIFFYIMASPLLERLIWQTKPEGLPVDQIIKKLRWCFSILYQNAIWAPDIQYGLQTETVRLYVQLFWIFMLLGMIAWFRGTRKITVLILAVCSLCFFVNSNLPSSIYRQDESWDGIFADVDYYEAEDLEPQKKEIPQYRFVKYDMNVDIKNSLKVSGEFTLVSERPIKDIEFTLYHGYKLKDIRSEDSGMTHERQGDKVFVSFDKPIERVKLAMEYEGTSVKYYSNSQGIMLPGYFSWYPMAGEKQIFVQYPYYNGGNGYYPYNRIWEAEFLVNINSKCVFVTNLSRKEGQTYTGTSDSLTILGGNIAETGESRFKNYLPLDIDKEGEETYLQEMESRWETVLKELEDKYGVDTGLLAQKKILLASEDLGRNFTNNNLVEFNDYILACDMYLDSGSYLNYLMYQHGKKSEIGNLFSELLLDSAEMHADEIIDVIIEDDKIKNQTITKEELLKKVVQYLLNDDMSSDAEFFASINGN